MGISELLAQLANPETVKTLSFADKMLASLVVTFLGMGITFLALIILQLVIGLLARFSAQPARQPSPQPAPPASTPLAASVPATVPAAMPAGGTSRSADDDDEFVAVISAVLAMYPSHPTGGIVIRNVRRIDSAPAWGKAGIVDQMNSRF